MKLIGGLFQHAFYVMKLEHDGSGLPTKFSSALLLVTLYGFLVIGNNWYAGTVGLGMCFSLVFIALVYTVLLRNQITGLIILIGIISSMISLLLVQFGALADWQLLMLSMIEYVMVFGALTNVIKSYIKLH